AAELVGVTRQLLGTSGAPFAYRGNVGPSLVPAPLMSRLRQLGNVLSSAFRLVGLFGVDYIQHDDEPWLVETNPRYTASVEVFELATHRTLLTEHLRACGMDLVESPPLGNRRPSPPKPRLSARQFFTPSDPWWPRRSRSMIRDVATLSRFPPSPMSPGRERRSPPVSLS
ncbi:MAG: ATP-grasp domain-containing protein, partial [Isosphaeraceae bacterium]